MNQEKLLKLVEALREAGQVTRDTLVRFNYGASPWDHNAQVDAAAKALVAEIEKAPLKQCVACGKLFHPMISLICAECVELGHLLEKA